MQKKMLKPSIYAAHSDIDQMIEELENKIQKFFIQKSDDDMIPLSIQIKREKTDHWFFKNETNYFLNMRVLNEKSKKINFIRNYRVKIFEFHGFPQEKIYWTCIPFDFSAHKKTE